MEYKIISGLRSQRQKRDTKLARFLLYKWTESKKHHIYMIWEGEMCIRDSCGNATEAEDILQDVFIEIYRNLPALKDNMAFCAWQRQIAYRCCLRNAKKNSQTDILGNLSLIHI